MKTRIGGSRRARSLALCLALCACTGSVIASAQPSPTPPAPSAPPPGSPPPSAPPDDGTPPPLAGSPMLGDEAPPPPAPATDETPPPPVYEPPPPPEEPPPRRSAGPFARGSIRLSLLIGSGWTATDQYFILGAGVGYYLLDGLELGLDYEAWLFASPVLNRLSPGLRYVFHMVPVIKPYVGGFYRHTFVGDNYEDLNYLGGRAGIFYVPKGGGVYLGGGAVYEHQLGCKPNAFVDCDDVYPEIFVGISF